MTSHHLPHYRCCGIQITFHEQCGHTLTATDHHPACLQPCTQPSLTLPQPFPQPYPKCKDLHRYIHLQPSNCPSCNAPPTIGNWDPSSSSFSSGKEDLSQEEIFERGVYWLNELLDAREEGSRGEVADWEACLRHKRGGRGVWV
jgi:hypothetical protein